MPAFYENCVTIGSVIFGHTQTHINDLIFYVKQNTHWITFKLKNLLIITEPIPI